MTGTAGGSSYAPTFTSSMAANPQLAQGATAVGAPPVPDATFMQSMSQVPSAIGDYMSELGQYAQQNPVLTQMAFQTGQSLLQKPERQLQSPGLIRGNPIQAQAPQYQLGSPKISLI